KKALAFMDVSIDATLSRAQSIIMQGIHSIVCAPLTINDNVAGILYVDYLFNQRVISEEDVRLVAQIARFAAIKLEQTRLREDAIQKRLIDEELKTASAIQRRLLALAPDNINGYTFVGANRPCRTDGVSEAENHAGEQMGSLELARLVEPLHGQKAGAIAKALDDAVHDHIGDNEELGDDVTLLVVSRNPA